MARSSRADVAKLAGVAPSTVSLVLNGHAEQLKIAPDTVQRVQEAANSLGYVPHAAARSLRSQKSRLLGLFMPDLTGDFFIPIVQQVVLQAIAAGRFRGYTVVPILHPLESPATLRSIMRDLDLAGAICHVQFANHPLTSTLTKMDVPRVYISPHETEHEPVGHGLVAMREAQSVTELFNAIEHKDLGEGALAYVSGPEYSPVLKDAITTASGVEPIQVSVNSWAPVAAETALASLWKDFPKVNEVWCSLDVYAIAARSLARASGRRVPEDVQIIGFGDREGMDEIDITSIYWPLKEMTDLALHRLVDAIEGDDSAGEPELYSLPTTIRLRGSTRNLVAPEAAAD
ncbi:LacI family DNA-binding transcriptional regulator [Bowdeniella massiliensis]|uniref:LacI family DNA-binding transcriptional regulator n=1 Tax=Bowdeniella massiliensis TaxID=2932264 RepID=UPI0025420E2D|nr:LacI family DNA-binding transcriptional regulator [Bowdeniella massiliensis]